MTRVGVPDGGIVKVFLTIVFVVFVLSTISIIGLGGIVKVLSVERSDAISTLFGIVFWDVWWQWTHARREPSRVVEARDCQAV